MTQLDGVQEKGWGRELIWATNDKYCGKIMYFDHKGAKFSMHFHKDKDESWLVLNGEFDILTIDTKDASISKTRMKKMDSMRIKPCVPHQVICIEQGTIVEVSTPDSVEDNYRVAKGDSQK